MLKFTTEGSFTKFAGLLILVDLLKKIRSTTSVFSSCCIKVKMAKYHQKSSVNRLMLTV